MDHEEDLESFKKVEDVSQCIKRLVTSNDSEALDAADSLLKQLENRDNELKTTKDRTLINQDSSLGDSTGSGQAHQSDDAFLREISRDAAERATRRERNRERAAEWKDRGNGHFKLANYARAVECYTKGLEIAKDFEVLYQNRANCYVKQGKFAEALADAEAAIFLTQERCAKPFFHQAKALTGLDRLEEARAAYRRMGECPDAAAGHSERCAAELDRVAAARADEARVLADFNAGSVDAAATAVDTLIYRLARGDQPAEFYTVGMRFLAAAVTEGGAAARALFRAKSGFSLIAKQRAVVAAVEAPLTAVTQEQADLLASTLTLCAAVCTEDAENCHRLLQLPALVAKATEAIAAAPASSLSAARQAAMDALAPVCELACDKFCSAPPQPPPHPDPLALLPALLGHVQRQPAREAEAAARLLDRLAACQRLRDRLQRAQPARLAALSAAAESLMKCGSAESLVAFVDAAGALRRLAAGSPAARAAAAQRRAFLDACEAAAARYAMSLEAETAGETPDELQQAAAASVLGLLACAALEPSPAVSERSPALASLAMRFLAAASASPESRQFALAMLASLAPREPAVAGGIGADPVALGLIGRVLDSPDHPGAASALRVLAAALRGCSDARRCVGDDARWLDRLLELLHSQSDGLLGNAALCLGHCVEDTAAAELLARTDVVRLLLCRMRDCRDREAKANCAILCGRLAQSHHGHREKLRELDGINILNSVLVNNNIKL